jgi:hypothetical protein
MYFQGNYIRLWANASCFSCPAPNLFEGQGDMENKTKFHRNDLPAKTITKVFDATFYKKLRFAPLSKSGS